MNDLLQRLPVGLIVGVLFAFLGWDVYDFMVSPNSELNQRKVQLEANQKSIEVLRAKLKKSQESEAVLEAKRTEIKDFTNRIEQLNATITREIDVATFVKMVLAEAAKVGLRIQSIHPVDMKVSGAYAEQVFEMNYSGAFVQLVMFMERVANLERIVRIENFDMKRIGSAAASYVELSGVLQLKTYRYAGTTK